MTLGAGQAQYAFFYCLALVSLILTATAIGSVFFQWINKSIEDGVREYRGGFEPNALKFAISAILIAGPVYFFTTFKINRALFKGDLPAESGIRRWLSYFILFVSSVVTIGYLIGILFSFLDGEITLKFILKALTALMISNTVFAYYFYDIKRKKVIKVKDRVIKLFLGFAVLICVISLVIAFAIGESPGLTRARKQDEKTLSSIQSLERYVERYYHDYGELPGSLDDLSHVEPYKHEVSDEDIEYRVLGTHKYQLCGEFNNSSDIYFEAGYLYKNLDKRWRHEQGRFCFEREVKERVDSGSEPVILRPVEVN